MSKKLSIMIYQSTFFVFLYINQCFISLFNHVDCSCVFSTKFMLLILRNRTLKCILSLNKEKTISVLHRYLRMFQFIIHKHNIFKQFQVLVNTTFCFKALFVTHSFFHPPPTPPPFAIGSVSDCWRYNIFFLWYHLSFFYFNSAFSMKLLINHLLFMY